MVAEVALGADQSGRRRDPEQCRCVYARAVTARRLRSRQGSDDIAGAVQRYEATRRERTARVQLTSRQNNWGKGDTDTNWVNDYNAWTAPLADAASRR
jgi:hypothetical protein